jgi:hypothetical protein
LGRSAISERVFLRDAVLKLGGKLNQGGSLHPLDGDIGRRDLAQELL